MYRILKIIGCLALACLMFSCSKKEEALNTVSGPVSIRVAYWGAVEEKEIITRTINAWESTHPGIKIILEHIPNNTYTNKILTEIAGGNPPDVIFSEVNIFVDFYNKGVLLDLTPFLKTDRNFNIKDFFPEVVRRFTRDGKIFCIPRDTAPFGVIFYNKNLFDKAGVAYPSDGWDMDDFLKKARALTFDETGKRPDEPGFSPLKVKQYGFWGWALINFIYSFGGRLVDDIEKPAKCLMNERASVEGTQFFVDLSHKYRVSPRPDALSNMGIGINQLFAMGRLAMFQSGIWETPNLRKIVGDKFDWDVVMFPKGPRGRRGFGTGGSGYAILKTTKHPAESWEVIKCLAQDSAQELLADTGLAQPANKKIAEGEYWAKSKNQPRNKGMLNDAVKYVVYDPFHQNWRMAWDKYAIPEIDSILNKKVTPQEGMDKIAAEIDKLLKTE